MNSFSPTEIYRLEKQLGYSWRNLQPFYILCESVVPEVYQMGAFCMEFLSWDGTLFFRFFNIYYSTKPIVQSILIKIVVHIYADPKIILCNTCDSLQRPQDRKWWIKTLFKNSFVCHG